MMITAHQGLSTEGDDIQLFVRGNQALNAGDPESAITDYRSLLAGGLESADIHYNLGLAYFRRDDLGGAIFHFRKAKSLEPRDADTKFNLEYARKQAKDKIERTMSVSSLIEKYYPLSPLETFYGLFASLVLLGIFGCTFMVKRGTVSRWGLSFCAASFLGFGAFFIALNHANYPFAVIARDDCPVYSGNSASNVLLFKLNRGAEVDVFENDDDWLRIRLADGKKGWVRSGDAVF
jgi:tetratricopeptide (TPR) repeat protein